MKREGVSTLFIRSYLRARNRLLTNISKQKHLFKNTLQKYFQTKTICTYSQGQIRESLQSIALQLEFQNIFKLTQNTKTFTKIIST